MLAPNPLVTAPAWPAAADAAELLTIVQRQALTIAAQEALIDDYQSVLAGAQLPPPATATGTGTGTNLVVTGSAGVILVGSVVTGTGIPAAPPNTVITGQQSGTPGGDGTYTTSVATTAASAALTFTPGGGASPWPTPRDADTLNAVLTAQTAIIRNQTALIQQYQELLNASQTPVT